MYNYPVENHNKAKNNTNIWLQLNN
jgi:hypothetical protein